MSWIPQPRQRLALSSDAFELLFGGARGGGKSDMLLGDITQNMKYGKPSKAIIFRHTYPQLEELISRSYDIYKPLDATFNMKTNTWSFPGGGTLKMRPLDNDNDVRSYQGHQYTWVGWDELTNWSTDFAYLTLLGCVRSAHGVPCYVRAGSNPRGPGHGWVKKRFLDPSPPMIPFIDPETGLKRVFIPSRLEDNMALTQNDPLYEARLKSLPEELYKAYRYGDWDSSDGNFFENFDRSIHVVKPFAVPKHWKKFACMDWGYAKPFAIYWVAVDYDGRGYVYREYYGMKGKYNEGMRMDASEVAKNAFSMGMFEGCEELVADPACWIKHGTGSSIIDDFKKVGFSCQKAINDRKNGAMRIHRLLAKTGSERPLIQIFDTCINLIRTLPNLPADKNNPEDIDTSVEDHAYDAIRYGAMSRQWGEYKPIFKRNTEYNPLTWGDRR